MSVSKTVSKTISSYWLWVAVIVIGGIFFFFLRFDKSVSMAGDSQIVIYFGNSASRTFRGPVVANMTILEALYSSSLGGNFDLRYSIDEVGAFKMIKIGDIIEAAGSPDWHFYLNGKPVDINVISRTKIESGDQIEAKYE